MFKNNPDTKHSQKKERPQELQITEDELRSEINRRIYRRIASSSSLENFSQSNVDDAKFYYQNRDRKEPDTQFNMDDI